MHCTKEHISKTREIANSPATATIFEGKTNIGSDICQYYIRLTYFCISPSIEYPFLSLYMECDELAIYECQMYLVADGENTILIDKDWTEAPIKCVCDLINFVQNNFAEWMHIAEQGRYYINLGQLSGNFENSDNV